MPSAQGLRFDEQHAIEWIKTARPLSTPAYRVHRSLKSWWHVAAFVRKKRVGRNEGSGRYCGNRERLKQMEAGEQIHESMREKMKDDPTYQPGNLPDEYPEVVWERLEDVASSDPV
ncbi:MAG: hypothetical protein RhofKO_32180 [Rhodothermales bacterium]